MIVYNDGDFAVEVDTGPLTVHKRNCKYAVIAVCDQEQFLQEFPVCDNPDAANLHSAKGIVSGIRKAMQLDTGILYGEPR